MTTKKRSSHIVLTSHPQNHRTRTQHRPTVPIRWGAATAEERGPVIATLSDPSRRNVIGTHSGSYTIYRALATAAGALQMDHRPDLHNTAPVEPIGPFDSWKNQRSIVSIDPWGAVVASAFEDYFKQGFDIRPTIAVTKAHISMMELTDAIQKGRLSVDGELVHENHDVAVTKAAIDPVWYLPGIAERFRLEEGDLRKSLFQETGGMYPELVTRPDLKIFLPPIGSTTVYLFGDVSRLGRTDCELTVRVHDECNGSDVFGSDICTCRPYLIHGIEEAIRTAQRGGLGAIVYYRKEGRALGEVTKFLVYNARKRQVGGDTAANYFYRTECVAGVQDMRFQELMPDVLHWLGISRIDRLVSMSDMKYNAIVKSGIQVRERISIPDDLIPRDARVEMEAKKAAGYFTSGSIPTEQDLARTQGRGLYD